MTSKAKAKADELVHEYRLLFMEEGDDYGEEILVSVLSRKCAKISVQYIIKSSPSLPILSDSGLYGDDILESKEFWNEVLKEIELLD